jgi:hypothetical protein
MLRIPTRSRIRYCYHNRSNEKLHSHLQFIQLRRNRGIAMFRIFVRLGLLATIGLAQDCVHGTDLGGGRNRPPPSRIAVLVTSVLTRE